MKNTFPTDYIFVEERLSMQDVTNPLTVASCIFTFKDNKLKILLIKYEALNLWVLPGGFVNNDEALRDAAERIVFYWTKLSDLFLKQFHTFGRLDRTDSNEHQSALKKNSFFFQKDHWIHGRFITVGYCCLIKYEDLINNDAFALCQWFDVDTLPPLGFDNNRIIDYGREHLRKNLDTNIIASKLLPEQFTMRQLQDLYEIVLGETFRRNNFKRKVMSFKNLEKHGKLFDGSANRAPYLYSFSTKENFET